MRPFLIGVFFLVLGLPQSISAAKLVCGQKVIHVGDSVIYLRKACGEPSAREQETRRFDYGGRLERRCFVGETVIERWTYELAFGRVPMILTIVDGEVEGIHAAIRGRTWKWQSPCA
ncbi:MAG TPA: DUF2845 domain-containing protein [Gammaproteobacteria bacterium]|nr:DUF2845 domain-containing protein [Gammaproteobacteria bacterium]